MYTVSGGLIVGLNFQTLPMQLSAPISIGETFEGTVIKYDRKEYNRLLHADQESASPKPTVRQRERGQNQVITLSSVSVVEEEVMEEEHRWAVGSGS